MGAQARHVSINPSLILPFLNENNKEEAALKFFLKSIRKAEIYNLPSYEVAHLLAEHAIAASFEQDMTLREGDNRLIVYTYTPKKKPEVVKMLLLLLQNDSSNLYYLIEMEGEIAKPTLVVLSNISPEFLDGYIRRFNIQF